MCNNPGAVTRNLDRLFPSLLVFQDFFHPGWEYCWVCNNPGAVTQNLDHLFPSLLVFWKESQEQGGGGRAGAADEAQLALPLAPGFAAPESPGATQSPPAAGTRCSPHQQPELMVTKSPEKSRNSEPNPADSPHTKSLD